MSWIARLALLCLPLFGCDLVFRLDGPATGLADGPTDGPTTSVRPCTTGSTRMGALVDDFERPELGPLWSTRVVPAGNGAAYIDGTTDCTST